MTSAKPLQGLDLIDCAKANASLGIDNAARNCGYGENVGMVRILAPLSKHSRKLARKWALKLIP